MEFDNVEGLLSWTAEVLRGRRWASIGQAYDEVGRVDAAWKHIPQNQRSDDEGWAREDGVGLAAKVWGVVEGLPDGQGEVLALWLLGDYATAERLKKAMVFQEAMRRQGMRVRLSYTYSYRQLALLWGCDRETAGRRVRRAVEAAERPLMGYFDTLIYNDNIMINNAKQS